MPRLAYVNGRYTPLSDAQVHVEDRGFQFADGVYEYWAVLGGKLADAEGHLGRLERSLSELRIRPPMSRAALVRVLHETVRRNRFTEGSIYLQVTRGAARRDHPFPSPSVKPSVIAIARPADYAAIETRAAQGVGVLTQPDIRWGRCDIKTVGLLPNILRGITRHTLMRLASELQIKVVEEPFTVAEAKGAKEAFFTAASAFITPVTTIDGEPVGDGRPGPISMRLRTLYFERARQDAL